jgi:GTP pyrophosphokinase
MTADQQYIQQLEAYFPGKDREILDKLIDHASYLYKSLYRYSGEPYISRALRLTCEKILKLNPDRATIMASILISACYSPRCDLDKIEQYFGVEVRRLVAALGKINSIKSRYSSSDTKVISNMFMTLAEDIRVILIRLADRLENMETLQFKTPEKQKANAREILDVYVPIASRLGLYEFKLLLEDMAFRYVFPEEYNALQTEMHGYLGETQKTIEDIRSELEALMKENGFDVKVSGRIKNLFSIYKKLKQKTRTIDQIYDVYAMRIVLNSDENVEDDSQDDIEKLYKVLSILHSKYENLPDRFKDYVSNPKSNGYKSLHTALVGLNSRDVKKPTEVQIRTAGMHKFAEHGYAAHWLYKERNNLPQDETLINALNDLRRNWGNIDIGTAELKMNLYNDRVFVLTPDNLVKELPVGSTPLDFAFAIHSEIGHHCYLAKVNGNVVALDYELKNGDVVEIITTPKVNTKLSWMEFVKTKQARSRIKSFFKDIDKDPLLDQGREELNALLERLKMEKLDEHLLFLKNYKGKSISFGDREAILEDIGAGRISPSTVFKQATGKSPEVLLNPERNSKPQSRKVKILPRTAAKSAAGPLKLIIGGEKDMPYRISSCCKPKLTDQIVGYITKTKGVSIHKITCSFVSGASADRLLKTHLSTADQEDNTVKYQVSLLLEMEERQGYLKEIIDFFNKRKVTILTFAALKKDGKSIKRRIIIDIANEEQLDQIIANLEMIDGVTGVSRM